MLSTNNNGKDQNFPSASSGRHTPLSAGGWSIVTFAISYAIGFLYIIPLVRLDLLPSDALGLYAIATVVSSALTLMIELSLIRALVRTEGDRSEVAQATFWLSIWVGIGGAVVCALAGLPMIWIYNNDSLPLVMLALAPSIFATAIGVVPHAILSRELDFKRKLLPETISVAGAAVLALVVGFLHLGVYILITYSVVRAILNAAIAWWIVPWRPTRKTPSRQLVKQLLSFGVPSSGGELTLYARYNVDYAIGGARMGEDLIGGYYLAWQAVERPARLINAFFDLVGYSTFARLQAHRDRLIEVFISATRLLAALTLPLFLGVIFVRQEIVNVLFGERHLDIIEPLLPLLVLQALWIIFHPSAGLILALGKSRMYAIVNVVSLVITIGMIILATSNSTTTLYTPSGEVIGEVGAAGTSAGLAWAMLAAAGTTSVVWGVLAWYYLRPSMAQLWYFIKVPLLLTVTTLPAIFLAQYLTMQADLPAIVRLLAAFVAGGVVFLGVGWLCRKGILQDIARLRERLPDEIEPLPTSSELLELSS